MEYPMQIDGAPVRSPRERAVALPFDGSQVGTIFEATEEQVNAAVEAAGRAARQMRELTLDERSAILRKAHYRLLEERDEMAMAVCQETGKPLKEARMEVERAALTLLFSSEEAHRLHGEVVPMDASPAGKGRMGITVREPVGVIAAITPFNFPLNLAMHKIGPAIAGGNAIVHKPATVTPISAVKMARLFLDCGLPQGALNVITGPGGAVGDMLVFHAGVDMITFTGSAEVGQRIRNLAGLKRVTLELGSNSALILEEDADIEAAMPRIVAGSFAHSGQVCISIQRIYVQEGIRTEFIDRFQAATAKLAIGHPYDPATDISSLITVDEAERVVSWVGEAIRAGGKLITGGGRQHATVAPAIVADVPPHVSLCRKEAFGPVVAVNTYGKLDEAVAMVNDSDYGLQAGIYTRDIQKAFQAARQVHVGGFHINETPQYRIDHMPYGGVKLSGTGREGPKYAVEEMTEPKLITWRV
ncbi:MAG: aldehyde dehydrogenase family protein [Acidobacteria bacterium]|nr:aldehyde dehydrogenase family protein [Acidobacteriota bacterium]